MPYTVGRGAVATWLYLRNKQSSQPSKSSGTSSSPTGRFTTLGSAQASSSPAAVRTEDFFKEGIAPPANGGTQTSSPFSVSLDTNREQESVCATVSRFFSDLFNPS
jgi:hypothetical protein